MRPLLAWEYDSRFRVLQGWTWIAPIPSGSGEAVYRIPANATLEPPPAKPPWPKVLVFVPGERGAWTTIADHRGERWFDERDRPVTVERLGDPELWGWNREPVVRSASGLE